MACAVSNQSINQSIKVICNVRNVVHKLESEARAVASGRVLMVIEKVGLRHVTQKGQSRDLVIFRCKYLENGLS